MGTPGRGHDYGSGKRALSRVSSGQMWVVSPLIGTHLNGGDTGDTKSIPLPLGTAQLRRWEFITWRDENTGSRRK